MNIEWVNDKYLVEIVGAAAADPAVAKEYIIIIRDVITKKRFFQKGLLLEIVFDYQFGARVVYRILNEFVVFLGY